jgi:lipopolysaccharide export system permease protein
MIVKDLFMTVLSVLVVIVVIIVSRKFIRILDDAISGQVSNDTLLSILGLKTIVAAVEFLPVALFMAVLMVMGRMYRDHEMTGISSAGGGAGTLYRALCVLVLPLSLLASGLSLYVAPWAESQVDHLMQQGEASADQRGIAEGKFTEFSQGDLIFYVEKIDAEGNMYNVFVQNSQHGDMAVINAESAQFRDLSDGRYLIFEQGEQVKGLPGALNYVIEQFDEYAVRVDAKATANIIHRQSVDVGLLWGSEDNVYIAELQRRFSTPLGLLLLSFIAVPLAQISPRGGVYGNVFLGFLIYFTYGNLLRASEGWVINQTIPPWLGGIGVNVLLLIVGVILLGRLYGWKWLLLRAVGKEEL